jgi:hypothetical protein
MNHVAQNHQSNLLDRFAPALAVQRKAYRTAFSPQQPTGDKGQRTKNYCPLAQRNPTSSPEFDTVSLTRFAVRELCSPKSHEPPRRTRADPELGPVGLLRGELM